MRILNLTFILIFSMFLSSCQQNDDDSAKNTKTESQSNVIETTQQKPQVQTQEVPQKILLSEEIVPLSTLDLDQDTYVFVQLSGTVINVAKDNSWIVFGDGGKQFFAFGHAGMEMFSADAVGQKAYIRAAVEKLAVDDRLFKYLKSRGLAPDAVSEQMNRVYQLNTTKFAKASDVSKKDFAFMPKL